MGLTSGDHGVKSLLRERYGRAWKQVDTLGDLRKMLRAERAGVSACHDGNVLMMQVPRGVRTLEEYVFLFTSMLKTAMGSAAVVVVCFDRPEIMTQAKREEQQKRDAARGKKVVLCSDDIQPYPQDDDFGVAEMEAAADIHEIIGCRPARQRAFDEICVRTMARLEKVIDDWREAGHGSSALLFDGIDPRGASRPVGAPREPALFGTCSELAARLAHAPAGEGDIALALVQQKVRELAVLPEADRPALLKQPALHLTVTIDTDSLAIELLEVARRSVEAPEMNNAVRGVLAFREPNRKHALDRRQDDEAKGATYAVVDYDCLFRLLQRDLWAPSAGPTPLQQRMATALLTTGFALAGSDFVAVKGMRADLCLDVVKSLVRASPALVLLMDGAWKGDRTSVKAMVPALRRLVLLALGEYQSRPKPRKACVSAMETVAYNDDQPLLRAAWTAAYWSGVEIVGDLDEFGFSRVVEG